MEQSGIARRRIRPRRGRHAVPRRPAGEGEAMSDGSPDVMDTLAGLAEGSAMAELRRQRPDVVRHLQGSDDAIFAPAHHGGFTRPEREAAALRVAMLLRDGALGEHYRRRLVALGEPHPLNGARGEAVLAHVDCVTMSPDSATQADLDRLLAAGPPPHAVVALRPLDG